MSIFFELETATIATPEETMLLYGLAEELLLKDKFVQRYSRISTDIVRIEVVGINDATRALAHVYNALRQSKNIIARTCAVTII